MTMQNAPAGTAPATSAATLARPAPVPAPPSWAWRRGALILAGAAQLITISALTSADPLAVTWASLLLAVAPAPLAAAAAFAPAPVNRLAAVIAELVLVAGIAGSIVHTGLFFVPALVVLAVGGVKLWSEQSRALVGLLGLDGARFEYGSLLGHPPRLEPDGTATVGHSRWDVELAGLPAEEIELRTFGNGQYYGRFMLTAKPGSKPSHQARPRPQQAGEVSSPGAGCRVSRAWAAAALSLGASAVLVVRLERVGARLGLSEALLGLVAALAADTPEVTSAVTALAHGQHDVGTGVVLGSNVFNLAALIGLGAVVAGGIRLHRRVVIFEGTVALWIAALAIAAVTGLITPAAALVLTLVVLVPYVYVSAVHPSGRSALPLPPRLRSWLAGAVAEEEQELSGAIHPGRGGPRDAAIAVFALAVVVAASAVMERTASTLGTRWAVPGVITGGIVLAAVTSMPNAVAAVFLARRGRAAATLSEAFNSNTLNVLAGLLIPAVIIASPGLGGALRVAVWYGVLTVTTIALALAGRGINRRSGALIIAAYLVFAVTVIVRSDLAGRLAVLRWPRLKRLAAGQR